MEPIEIEAQMIGGVAYNPGEGLSIDGPLAYAAVLEREGEAFFSDRPSNKVLARETATPNPDMPLSVHEAGGMWCYQCSSVETVGPQASQQLHRNTRFDDGMAAAYPEALDMGRRRVVRTNSGSLKSYHMPLYLELSDTLRWYAVGDPDEVERLLRTHIHHLGKAHNAGHGRVAQWTVRNSDELEGRWMWRDTEPRVPARPIPVDMLDEWDGERAVTGFRPPYWLAANQALCATP